MKPNELIDNMVEKSKAEVKPTIPQKPAATKPKAFTDYKGVEKTPYGHVYNFNGGSITDLGAERTSMKMPVEKGKNYGFTYTKGGDEIYADTFEDAYKALGGKIGESPKPKMPAVAKAKPKPNSNIDLDEERSWGPVRYKNVNEAYADFEKYLGSGEPDEIDRFNNAAEQLDEYLEPLFANKEEKAKWDNISQTGTGEQIIDMAKSIIERSQKPQSRVPYTNKYKEASDWYNDSYLDIRDRVEKGELKVPLNKTGDDFDYEAFANQIKNEYSEQYEDGTLDDMVADALLDYDPNTLAQKLKGRENATKSFLNPVDDYKTSPLWELENDELMDVADEVFDGFGEGILGMRKGKFIVQGDDGRSYQTKDELIYNLNERLKER